MAGGATFSCDSCGKQYPWKPELAGKKAKCKCGALISIPAQAPARTPVAVAAAAPVDESQGYRCPACKGDLTPGQAICVGCGYDLRTGQYVNTQVGGDDEAKAAPTPKKKKKKVAAAGAGGGGGKPSATGWVGVSKSAREKRAETEKDNSRTIKQVVIALVLCVVVVGVVFGGKFIFKAVSGKKVADPNLKGQDAEAMRLLDENQPMEAKAFIESHKSRMLGMTWTQAKALLKIQQWYDMGAVKVLVPSDGLIARVVIIELPEDKEKRQALINWQAVNEDEQGHILTVKDEGQKYVLYHL
jgi:hypothetical protein